VYTIEHNVKVKPYGVVKNQFMHALITQWTQVFMGRSENLAQLAFRSSSQQTLRDLGFTPSQITSATNILTKRGASPYNAITSIAWASAEIQLVAEDRKERAVKRYANHVVDLILAGMNYSNAVSHVKLIAANEETNDDDDDDDDNEEDEDEDDDWGTIRRKRYNSSSDSRHPNLLSPTFNILTQSHNHEPVITRTYRTDWHHRTVSTTEHDIIILNNCFFNGLFDGLNDLSHFPF
jgi:hypothetical protein